MLSLFFPFTKIFLGVPSAVVIFTGSKVIVPIDGLTLDGIVTVNVLLLVLPIAVPLELYVVNTAVIVPLVELGNWAYIVVLFAVVVPEMVYPVYV